MKHWLSFLWVPPGLAQNGQQANISYMADELIEMYKQLRIKEREMLGIIGQIERLEQDALGKMKEDGVPKKSIDMAKKAWMAEQSPCLPSLNNHKRPSAWPALLARHCEYHNPSDRDDAPPAVPSAS